MISRKELYKTEEYWLERIQNDVFHMVHEYQDKKKLNQSQLAKELDVSRGYISQILNGNFNFSLKKLIELCLQLGVAPQVNLECGIEEYIEKEEKRLAYMEDNGLVSFEVNTAGVKLSSDDPETLQIA